METQIDNGAQYQWMNDGKRLRLLHGPIDLILEASGTPDAVATAYQQAYEYFNQVLTDLVAELACLRQPLDNCGSQGQGQGQGQVEGHVAKRMVTAAIPYANHGYITPMIAVAGAVADSVLEAMMSNTVLTRAYVNNGGDIALWLAPGEVFTIGVCEDNTSAQIGSTIQLQAADKIGGVATSGWRGRSHSLGIADAVTVLASCSADADTAATLIANAVDLPGSSLVQRVAANELSPDSDLGNQLVTVGVNLLDKKHVDGALERGRRKAMQLLSHGRIATAYLSLQGQSIVCVQPKQTIRAGVMHA